MMMMMMIIIEWYLIIFWCFDLHSMFINSCLPRFQMKTSVEKKERQCEKRISINSKEIFRGLILALVMLKRNSVFLLLHRLFPGKVNYSTSRLTSETFPHKFACSGNKWRSEFGFQCWLSNEMAHNYDWNFCSAKREREKRRKTNTERKKQASTFKCQSRTIRTTFLVDGSD